MNAARWLDVNTGGAPESLRAALHAAVAGSPAAADDSVPQTLGDAALQQLAGVLPAPAERSAALGLLAADALLTAAFEAAAEDPAVIHELAARYSMQRLADLLDT